MIAEKSMLLVTSQRAGAPTFRMMPLTNKCPFIEAVYEPRAKALIIFYKHKVEGFHMMDQLDSNGDPVKAPKPRASGNTNKEERKMLKTAHEAYITDKKEIEGFVNMFAFNTDFDYKKLMVDPKLQAETPNILLDATMP